VALRSANLALSFFELDFASQNLRSFTFLKVTFMVIYFNLFYQVGKEYFFALESAIARPLISFQIKGIKVNFKA
jgi:hypothetical protein